MGLFEASPQLERGQKEGTQVSGPDIPVLSYQGFDPLCHTAVNRLAGYFLGFDIGLGKFPLATMTNFDVAKNRIIVKFEANM